MIPDTFFLIHLTGEGISELVSLGPYTTFLEASTIALDFLEVAAVMRGIKWPPKTQQTVIYECVLNRNKVEIICERGTDINVQKDIHYRRPLFNS